jgi:hypothetical protein
MSYSAIIACSNQKAKKVNGTVSGRTKRVSNPIVKLYLFFLDNTGVLIANVFSQYVSLLGKTMLVCI